MMKDITLGQYFPGNSLLHRLDPRMKLVLTLFFIVLVFLPRNWWGLLTVGLFLLLVIDTSSFSVEENLLTLQVRAEVSLIWPWSSFLDSSLAAHFSSLAR